MNLRKFLFTLLIGISFLSLSNVTQAMWCHHGYCHYGHVYRAHYYNNYYYVRHNCEWVPGHYGPHGHWIHGHKVCWW